MKTINTYYQGFENLSEFVQKNKDIFFDDDNTSVMVQVFCGVYEKDYMALIIDDIKRLVPYAQIIGATTSGEIMNGKVSGLKTVISFSFFKKTNVKLFFMEKEKNSFEMGVSIASQINSEKAKVLIMFSSGSKINPNKLLSGVKSVTPHLPVAGGVAGNNVTNEQGYVFCNKGITNHGAVAIVLESDELLISQNYNLCWIPIGKEMTITKADVLRVYTIDNKPAFQVYQDYLGVKDNSKIIINSIFPLISKRDGTEIVRTALLVNDDGSIIFSGDLKEGEKVRFSFGQVDMIIESVDKLINKINKNTAESIFVYSCTARRGFLQEYAEIETLPLQDIAATSGFFTNGEFYRSENENHVLNATMTTLVLSESINNKINACNTLAQTVVEDEKAGSLNDIKDNVESGSIEILKAMTHLVNKVTKELDDRTKELELVNEKIKYESMHDALTGLFNRNFYKQEIDNLALTQQRLVGIIVCDVDGLKIANDTLGHRAGDELLKATANILKDLPGSNHAAVRIGGDEFAVFIRNCTQLDMKRYCKKIRDGVKNYNKLKPIYPLSLSIGFSICENAILSNLLESFKEADDSMYLEKRQKRGTRSELA